MSFPDVGHLRHAASTPVTGDSDVTRGERRRRSAARLTFGLLVWVGVGAVSNAWGRPLPTDAAAIKRGGAIYAQNCATCHGLKGKGDGPVASSLTSRPTDFTSGVLRHGSNDEELVKSITLGIPSTGMSGFKGRLSEAEITAVAAYVRSLKKP
ncbi:MAG: hypothetical protein EB084_05970 [Proteobacteria bacterium]|nr:hypothetical protein [Pseudomonadota bacterium]